MKIAVYANAHNEEANIDAWYESCKEADCIVVADSDNSTDGTVEKFRSHGVEPYKISIQPGRSDWRKNTLLALIPSDVDICIPLDLDERLMPGWRQALEAKWVLGEHTMAFHIYVFDHTPEGQPNYFFMQNRIHARHGYMWRYPAHEGLYPQGGAKHNLLVIPEVRIEQWQDRTKDRSGVISALTHAQTEYPNDTRMVYYYGRELMYEKRYTEAAAQLEHYLRMGPKFPAEQADAANCLANCYTMISQGKF